MELSENLTLIKAANILLEANEDGSLSPIIDTMLKLASNNASHWELVLIAFIYKQLGDFYDPERLEAIKKSLA